MRDKSFLNFLIKCLEIIRKMNRPNHQTSRQKNKKFWKNGFQKISHSSTLAL